MLKSMDSVVVLLFGWLYVIQGSTFSSGEHINVDLNNGILTCGNIVCPSGTDHCIVNEEYDSYLMRCEACYSASNEVLQQSNQIDENIGNNSKVRIRIEANTSGKISVCTNLENKYKNLFGSGYSSGYGRIQVPPEFRRHHPFHCM